MPFPQPPFGSAIQGIVSGGATRVVAVWQNWIQLVQNYMSALTGSGPTSARPTKDLWVGQPFFDTTINVPVYWNGSTWVTSAPAGTVTNVTGTAPIQSSGGTTPDISITQANASTNGYISASDWNTFNGKVSSVSGTSPIVSSGGTTPAISIPAASASTNGYLTSTDWTTFNNKQPAGAYVTSVTGTAPVVSTGGTTPVISMAAANSTTNGYLTSADWNSFNSAVHRNFVDVAVEYAPSYGGRTSAAIQAAINANPGRTIYLRGGTTNPTDFWAVTSSITITKGCTLVGDGIYTLIYPGTGFANSNLIDIETTEQVCIDNMQILGNNVTGVNGIKVAGGSGAENKNSRFSRLDIYACTTGILFYSAYQWTLVDSVLHSCSSQCLYITNVVNQDHGDCLISGCEFDQPTATGYCINQVGLGGIRIIGNKFINAVVHWLVVPNGNPINDAIFEGNSSENASDHHILLDGTNGVINNVVIVGNQIALGENKNNVTGIRLTGDGIDSPCQTNIMDNTIWVRHTNQTGIAITAGGYDGKCYNTIYVANNNLYSQRENGAASPAGQYAIAIQNIASVRCGVNNIAWNFISPTDNWASRYVISSSQKLVFEAGQTQNGQITLNQTGTGFGGGFYTSTFQPVTFAVPFPQAPNITVHINAAGGGSNTGGVFSLITASISATGFQVGTVGLNSSGSCICIWQASLTGQ